MTECKHFRDCEFVLRYVPQVKPHWDDFVSHYCRGDFQDICKRLQRFKTNGTMPEPDLMPNGNKVPYILNDLPG
jgi:hypothetical protein